MSVTVPLLCLIGILAFLSVRQAHHPWRADHVDRSLAVIASAQGLVVLVLALTQLFELTRP